MFDVARQPKAKPNEYGQRKTEKAQMLFTKEGLEIIDSLAKRCGLSRSDFMEKSARWLDDHWDTQLQRDLGKGEDESNA